MARAIDISLSISDAMLTWPGDPSVEVTPTSRLRAGDHANVSQLTLGSHTGTHVDPPFHFIDGAATVEQLSLDALCGRAHVVDLRDVEETIMPDHLERIPGDAERVLLLTKNSALWTRGLMTFPETYVAVSVEGARALVQRGVKLVGVDFLSIERRGAPGHPTHVALLEAGVIIVEGLNLSAVEPGEYTLMCLPLKIAGGDGAPARAVLLTD